MATTLARTLNSGNSILSCQLCWKGEWAHAGGWANGGWHRSEKLRKFSASCWPTSFGNDKKIWLLKKVFLNKLFIFIAEPKSPEIKIL
jgi:hypothetical protein